MSALTDLGQRRADTTAVHQAARALQAGCRPEQVAAFLAAYCGLPLERDPEPPLPVVEPGWIWDDSEVPGELWTTNGIFFGGVTADEMITFNRHLPPLQPLPPAPHRNRRRWWSRWT